MIHLDYSGEICFILQPLHNTHTYIYTHSSWKEKDCCAVFTLFRSHKKVAAFLFLSTSDRYSHTHTEGFFHFKKADMFLQIALIQSHASHADMLSMFADNLEPFVFYCYITKGITNCFHKSFLNTY